MQHKSSRAYERFLKAKLQLPEDTKNKVQPQETVEKMIQSLKKQQDILQKTLDECILKSENSQDGNDKSVLEQYHVEQLLMQISDQIKKLDNTLVSNMDKVGENIYNNLSQSNQHVEQSCETIEKGILGIHRGIEEKTDEQSQKIIESRDYLEKELKEYVDAKFKKVAQQDIVHKIDSKMAIILILCSTNIAMVIMNIILLFIR